MKKGKISANIDLFVLQQSEKLAKRMGTRTFSQYLEYVMRGAIREPESLIKSRIVQLQRELAMQQNLLADIIEVRESQQEEKVSPAPLPKEEV